MKETYSDKFNRTRAALKTFDDFTEHVRAKGDNSDFGRNFAKHDAERERLARLVGRAFGEDTADVNSPDTCESCVRPGEVRRFLVHETWAEVPA